MSWLQEDSFLSLDTPLGESQLLLVRCEAEETLSAPFRLSMTAISASTAISSSQLIGKPVTIKIQHSLTEPPRYFNGIVQYFQAGAIREGMRTYLITASSWLSLLNHAADCRIYQHKTVIEIVKSIFQDYGFANFDLSKLISTYKPLEYCVQFHETTLNFVQRILAEAGIYYYFIHKADRHILVLADHSSAASLCHTDTIILDTHGMSRGHHLTAWEMRHAMYGGKSSQSSYNFENPYLKLEGKQEKQAKLTPAQKYELYHYSGRHPDVNTGNQLAQRYHEARELANAVGYGEGNYLDFNIGECFSFTEPPVADDAGEYFITHMVHAVADSSYLSGVNSGASQSYINYFTCIPKKTPYRPAPLHTAYPKPVIHGPQTAVVVGPEGEEIYTDKYGRVKVHFHWVRNTSKSDKSSCWVRVAQHWAGQGFGTFFLPRIGQEVIVQFLDGDPDRPIIVGSVYNAEHMPPYSLPANQTQSGIKTHSSKGGGGSEANELRFEDKKGSEEVYLHAQKDYQRKIENDEVAVIVKGDHAMKVEAGKSVLEASQSIELKVGGNSIKITQSEISINGARVLVNKT